MGELARIQQRVARKYDAPAEAVLGPVALDDLDVMRGIARLARMAK
ncbi:MAG: hypothetical protein Q8O25_15340 [Sulfurisoma sp.]|nr:hypothetical protein [Sulfurisoma sp.]